MAIMTDYTIPMIIGMTLAFTLGAGLGEEEMLKRMRFQLTTLGRLDIKIVDGGIEG
jgi:hypothetical protein